MVRNKGQRNILQIFEENCYISIFYVPVSVKFLQDAILGIMFYIHMLTVLIIEFVPKMKYCFDLMFLNKINQVILVAILLFLDLRSGHFTFSNFFMISGYLSSRWILFSGNQNYDHVNCNYMAESRCQRNIL